MHFLPKQLESISLKRQLDDIPEWTHTRERINFIQAARKVFSERKPLPEHLSLVIRPKVTSA